MAQVPDDTPDDEFSPLPAQRAEPEAAPVDVKTVPGYAAEIQQLLELDQSNTQSITQSSAPDRELVVPEHAIRQEQSHSVSLPPPPPLPQSASVSKSVALKTPQQQQIPADEAGDAGAQWYAESTDAKLERIAGHIASLGARGPMREGAHSHSMSQSLDEEAERRVLNAHQR